MSKHNPTVEGHLDAKGARFALLASRWNDLVTSRLVAGAVDCLRRSGVPDESCTVVRVPGSWELPQAASRLAASGKHDAIIVLGTLIRGETPHFDVLAAQVAKGLGEVALRSGLPVIFGVLTTDTLDQAMERAGGKSGNKGWEAAQAAVEMVDLFRRLG